MIRIGATVLLILVAACEVFRGPGRPDTALSEREFVDVYVAVNQSRDDDAIARVDKVGGFRNALPFADVKNLSTFDMNGRWPNTGGRHDVATTNYLEWHLWTMIALW